MLYSRFAFILLSLCAAVATLSWGQTRGGEPGEATSNESRFGGRQSYADSSDELVISLLTILPGDDIYSLWGHSAIRVVDSATELDVSFNYGTFQFDAYFLPKFLYGDLDYLLSVQDYDLAIESYRAARRPVIEQELRLSPAQKDSLFAFLRVNARPENRVYRYHFVYDNCSTRIRDALVRSFGDDVSFAAAPDPEKTFRGLTDSGLEGRPFLDAGIDWLFGSNVDRVAEPYETMFLPLYLRDAFDRATIQIDETKMPLVARTDTVFWVSQNSGLRQRFPWAAAAAWLLFATGVLLTVRSVRGGAVVYRWFDVSLFLLVGLAGFLIAFLWFVSLHDVTERNWHLLWSWPTHVIVAVALWRGSRQFWILNYLFAAALTAIAAVALGPMVYQWIHPALYPLILVTALRSGSIFLVRRQHVTEIAMPQI